ncbi:fibronectin type III domain-containing protein [Occultella kanbiaonis]|uniref:fibronectin type III domain-containing protein n=1 Tax=Occultella kanbiaonis TaxID=2675754 RepID=UPI0013D79DFC|nr:fibronectin type III domain-containing protein [Occultella kanbiaonis]
MKLMVYTSTGVLVPLGGVPAGPGPDPEDPKVPPPAVIILSLISPSPTQLTATWLAPTDPNAGGSITHYEIDFDGADFNYSYPSTTITFGDLDPDTEYTVTIRAVNNFELVGPDSTQSAFTQVEDVYDAELGAIGDRPHLTPAQVKALSPANTGPRQATTRTLSGPAALAEALAAPVEADGRRYVRRARITSEVTFSNLAVHHSIAFEDCVLDRGWGDYAVRGWWPAAPASAPAGFLPEFRFCEFLNADSALLVGGHVRFLRCYLHHGNDLVKPNASGEFYACYFTDTWHPAGAHADCVQIIHRAADLLIHYNHFEGFNSLDSPTSAGNWNNAVLQTGSVTGDIGPVLWQDNYFNGGNITIRSSNSPTYDVHYEFRRNRWGRGYNTAPFSNMGHPSTVFESTNVWDDTGLPVTGP